MGIFDRIFKIGQAEANQVLDKMEDPIAMIEQAVRDLRKELGSGFEALAGTKVEARRARKTCDESAIKVQEFVSSAERLQAQGKGALALRTFEEAKRIKNDLPALKKIADDREAEEATLQKQVDSHQRLIADYERKLVTLRQRDKAVNAKEKFNKRRAGIDPTDAKALLERMEKRIEEKEASADAYGEIADQRSSVQTIEEEIRHALPSQAPAVEEDLSAQIAALKKELE